MPWTPIAVSAWRTSSSLKGLMIATTSFMVRPLFPWISLEHSEAGRQAVRCQRKSGIFLGKWHKKLAGRRGKHYGLVFLITVQATSSSAKIGFSSPAAPAGFPPFHGSRYKNVKPIVVLCIQRSAAGPLSGSAASRSHYPGHGRRGHVGLDRGDVGLAASR